MIRSPLRTGLVFTLAVLVLTAGAVTATTAAPSGIDSEAPALTAIQDDGMVDDGTDGDDDGMENGSADDDGDMSDGDDAMGGDMDDGMDNESMDDEMGNESMDGMDDEMGNESMDGDGDEMNDGNESDEMSDEEMNDDGAFGTVGFALVGALVVAGLGSIVAVRRRS